MSEEQMVGLVQGALAARGITDEVLAAGQFNPRGHTGGMFAGGLAGSEAGGLLGQAGEAVSLGVGSVAGMRAADARSGLPASMLIGVSATMVYGFAAATRHRARFPPACKPHWMPSRSCCRPGTRWAPWPASQAPPDDQPESPRAVPTGHQLVLPAVARECRSFTLARRYANGQGHDGTRLRRQCARCSWARADYAARQGPAHLLSPDEQALFARLGVFAGTFGLPAAEAVYGDAGAPGQADPSGLVIDILDTLVDSSLVQPETHGDEPRFGLLETIREYALGRLRANGAWEEVHDRHAAYFMALAKPAESELRGDGQLVWLNRLEIEVGNLGAALSWLMDQDRLDQAITFIWATWRFWWLRWHVAEVARHWETLMANRQEVAPHERALALSGTGFTFIADGDQDQARSAFEQSLPLFREAGDPLGAALAAAALGHVLASQHDYERAGDVLEQAMNLLREADTGERTEHERVQYLLIVALVSSPTRAITRLRPRRS
jgi:tetratricopeptide (TPR) repeat protein